MEDAFYQVIIMSHGTDSVPLWRAVSAFADLFSIPADEALARLEAAPCVARGRLRLDQAEKYCRVMRRLGIQCELRQEQPAARAAGIYPRLSH
jgi:hypothetical protein